MNSRADSDFWRALASLPREVQDAARAAYSKFRIDPFQRGLDFKQLHGRRDFWSVRIGLSYRAVGIRENDSIVWFWIGTHAEYDRIVSGR